MMHEVLTRYLAQAKELESLPDLIMVDGGKGQLNVLGQAFIDTGVDFGRRRCPCQGPPR